jgi:phosphohistidine phosphatase
MQIYLLRHAIAVPRGSVSFPNDDRPLTEEGVKKMAKAAKGAAKILPAIDVILSSPLKRAHETATIIARAIGAEHRLEICNHLLPNSSMKSVMSYLAKYKELQSILIVGHGPDIGFIASSLLGSSDDVIEFKKGALCCIETESIPPKNHGKLLWHLPPRFLRGIE